MAISLVQDVGISGPFTGYTGIIQLITGVTAGDQLILAVQYNSSVPLPVSVTDTAGSTWQFATVAQNNPPLAQDTSNDITTLVAWTLSAAASGNIIVTLSWGGATQFVAYSGSLSEWSGIGSETSGAALTGNSTPVQLTAVTIGTGGLFVGAAYQEFSSSLTPVNLTSFASDTTGYSGWAMPGAGSFAADWGSGGNNWGAAGAVFAPPVSGVTVSGAVSPLALGAPAGSITFPGAASGAVAGLALAALPGTPAVSGAATVPGPVAQLALSAPAGAPFAPNPGAVRPQGDSDRSGLLRKPFLW